jgi:hypothetical protein
MAGWGIPLQFIVAAQAIFEQMKIWPLKIPSSVFQGGARILVCDPG